MNPNKDFRNSLLHTLLAGAAAHVAANPHEALAIGKGINVLLNTVAPEWTITPVKEAA